MLFVDRGRRRAVEVPFLLVAVAGLLLFGALRTVLSSPRVSAVVGLVIVMALLVGVALASFRVVFVRGAELVVWTPFGRTSLDARACAFGVRVHSGGRGVSYPTYVTDGDAMVDVSDHGSVRAADAAVARLEAAFVEETSRRRSRAVAAVRRHREGWERQHREAKAQVGAYYQSPAWRRAKWLVVGGVVVYLIAMVAVQIATR